MDNLVEARSQASKALGLGMVAQGLFNTRGTDELIREKIETLYPEQDFTVECCFTDSEDPKTVESRLLRAYLEEHCELPPANHAHPTNNKALEIAADFEGKP